MEVNYMFSSIFLIYTVFAMMLVIVITIIAAIKKISAVAWFLTSFIGYLVLTSVIYIIDFRLFSLYHSSLFMIMSYMPVLYLIVLLIIVLVKPSKQEIKTVFKCDSCGHVIKDTMKFCPYCGETVHKHL